MKALLDGFWAQYPIGTRLDGSFLSRQFNRNRTVSLNGIALFFSLFAHIARTWPVLGVPFLRSTLEMFHRYAPSDTQAARITYYAFAIMLGIPLLGLSLLAVFALLLVALTVLPVLTGLVMGIWALVVFIIFCFWFAFYRYPVYEIVYPRIRTWILLQNSAVYSQLAQNTPSAFVEAPHHESVAQSGPSIRVVRLKAGSATDEIMCELIMGPLAQMNYEALSYVWGITLRSYKIQVNGRPFYITFNLHSALQQLRQADRDRFLWIDAMAINQSDNIEKSDQVQMMRDIYAKASRVVIWLGRETKSTPLAFNFVRQFDSSDPESKDTLWTQRTSSSRWREIIREFHRILEHEWWTRAWIVQEVVVGRDVLVQRGSHGIDWNSLNTLLTYPPFQDDEASGFNTPLFAEDIQKLRSAPASSETLSATLLTLAYRFRFQSATFGSDKIYSLLGLLPPDNPTLIQPDYSASPEDVFLNFAIACLHNNKNLAIIALASGVSVQGVSWCRDWRLSNDGSFPVTPFSTRWPNTPPFSASGTQVPIFETKPPNSVHQTRPVVRIKGYTISPIIKIGSLCTEGHNGVNWDFLLQSWERTASGPWPTDSLLSTAFGRTITVGRWSTAPLHWRFRIPQRGKPSSRNEEEKDNEYTDLLGDACVNRRFFVTQDGTFGLGPWDIRRGDEVCNLLGGTTPFVLRKTRIPKASASEHYVYHRVVGEAYLDGYMYYNGNLEDDIQSGQVVLKWYHLL